MFDVKFYHHGRFALAGGTLPGAVTAYRTFGDPKNPCIVSSSNFGGRLDEKGPFNQTWLIGEDLPLDPRKYFIVTFALFSNGESSSPSNTPPPYNGPYFPRVSYEDNIRAQYNVLTKELGVSKIFCVLGVSMGGQQAFHWATLYPDFVERFASICSAARTSPHNACVLDSFKFAMASAKDFHDGHYTVYPRFAVGAAQRILNTWAWSHEFYNEHMYLRGNTYTDLQDYHRAESEGAWLSWDANDMYTLASTWESGDISKTSRIEASQQGNLENALASIKAKALILPSKDDMFFTVEQNEKEVAAMKNSKAKLAVIPSSWGHAACSGFNPPDAEFMMNHLKEFLTDT
ncbi:hypothetical protein EIP86_010988 [Pleurotus ostreatoroseus]|nr:hypothetical protein EIP86_010988 [Pleurotus ostreatoroseus]